MMIYELIKEVEFASVSKELTLTDRKLEKVMLKLEGYYNAIKETELFLEPNESKIKVNREYFDISYIVETEEKSVIEELTTFVSVESILASQVPEEDLTDLEKPLILAGLLCLLTYYGTCFSEEERLLEVKRVSEYIEEKTIN